jgi:integrase
LAAWLHGWLERRSQRVRPNTQLQYQNAVRHLETVLGRKPLEKLTPLEIEHALNRMDANPPTKLNALKVLRMALGQAVKYGALHRNPAALVEPPRYEAQERAALSRDDVTRLLEHPAVKKHPLFALWYLAFATGLRRGELLGLRWQDVDTRAGLVYVRQQVIEVQSKLSLERGKTRKATRVVPIHPSTVSVLEAWRKTVEGWRLEATKKGGVWRELDLVFPTTTGEMRSPHGITVMFRRLSSRAGFLGLVLHEARHTAATLVNAQAQGDARLVADVLGHADARFTMDTYVHPDLSRLGRAALDLRSLERVN